ncbi:MAG: restriction endonuclease [Bacteroidales bacterium]|nr:restriction endonuclease [Bacteroidales bacterium]
MKQNRLTLNDVEWREFRIKDLFKIKKVKGRPVENYKTGKTPYSSTSSTNNAVINFIDANEHIVNQGNSISINPIDGKAFYHEYSFVGRGYSGASINVLYNKKLNKHNGLFLCKAIENTSTKKASYGYLFNSKRLENGIILLPCTSGNEPDWKFMENYVKQEQKEIAQKVINYYEQKILKTGFDLVGLEDVEWKVFPFAKIFRKIQRGRRLKKDDHIDGDIPYVSSTSLNDGVDEFIGNDYKVRKFKNNLTLANSGSVGSCFYHAYEYIASDHVTSLTLENADKYIYLFMATIVKRLEEKYSFNREINDKRIRTEKLILPADENGYPHWEYMSQFIQKLEVKKLEEVLEYIYIYRLAMIRERLLIPLKEKKWSEFWMADIVTISSGIRLTKANQEKGNRAFIGSSDTNNGVTEFVSNTNNSLDSNVLGVNYNGSVVENFYHPYEAIFSDDVKRIHWIDKSQEDRYTYLFLKQVILLQKVKYAYGYKFNARRMKRQKIMLPVKEDGTPDYEYMREYIQIEEIKQSYELLKYYRN